MMYLIWNDDISQYWLVVMLCLLALVVATPLGHMLESYDGL